MAKPYYQPEFDMNKKTHVKLWDKNGLASFQVYHTKKNAQKDFPGMKILAFTGQEIQNHSFVD